jgi:hypothetical protein
MIKFNVTLLICILLKIRERTNIAIKKSEKRKIKFLHFMIYIQNTLDN